jgi:uncharacterized repeat protein (TIGR01451 family)
MRRFWSDCGLTAGAAALVVVGSAIGFSTSAHAGAELLIKTTVSPIVEVLNVSTPTSVGYDVLVKNVGGSTASNVRFTANLPDGSTELVFEPVDPDAGGLSCRRTGNVLDCAIGQLKAGQSYKAFRIFFQVPSVAGTVVLGGTTYYAEGQGPNANPTTNSSPKWGPIEVDVKAVNNDTAAALVAPKARAKVTFGTSKTDLFSTEVEVPTSPNAYAPASIAERLADPVSFPSESNCDNFVACYVSKLDIKRTDGTPFEPALTVTLRMQAANAKNGTQIQGVVVLYSANDTDTYAPVGPCQAKGVAFDDRPCIDEAFQEKVKGSVKGDLVWKILSKWNGSYRLP